MTIRRQIPASPADVVLSRLRGYMYRQNFVPEDRAILTQIFDQWAAEVNDLERQLADTEARCAARCADLERQLKGMTFASYGYRTP